MASVMTPIGIQNWNIGQKSGIVSIDTHKLFLHITGPDRVPGQPVVVLMTGVTNTISGWAAVQRLTAPFARLVAYDRSGLGSSEKSPNLPSSATIARELDALLRAADIAPPYIMLGHSWGGILTQEFLALRIRDIVGMIFVDATQGRYLDLIPFADPAIQAVNKNLDWYDVIELKQESVLTEAEYLAFVDAERNQSSQDQIGLEFMALMGSYAESNKLGFLEQRPPVLGHHPVCVIKGHNQHDLEKAYHAGVKAGNGTEEERARYREMLSTWDQNDLDLQRDFLKMSDKSTFLVATRGGHNVHIAEPEVIAEGIKWTLASLEK